MKGTNDLGNEVMGDVRVHRGGDTGMIATSIILSHIESLGYIVKSFRVGGIVELHAMKVPEGEPNHVARSKDGDGEREEFWTAVILARAVGIDLDE